MDQTSGGQCPLMSGPRSFKVRLSLLRLDSGGWVNILLSFLRRSLLWWKCCLTRVCVCGLSVTMCKQVGHIKVKPYICNSKSGLI